MQQLHRKVQSDLSVTPLARGLEFRVVSWSWYDGNHGANKSVIMDLFM